MHQITKPNHRFQIGEMTCATEVIYYYILYVFIYYYIFLPVGGAITNTFRFWLISREPYGLEQKHVFSDSLKANPLIPINFCQTNFLRNQLGLRLPTSAPEISQHFNLMKRTGKQTKSEVLQVCITKFGVHHLQTIMTESCSGNLENLVCL